ncbi:ribosomal maturation YjgA family protein [Streptacidiphilus rugosus]|uniref:ribosomal maturation YjgA family protein n=1 Tax=Streptacidiphilus rugosus TaxID=405783 RepID=UPI00068F784A|nr:DUF2809 domain-containing protein [Streptacidiphilus rugosus]
MNDHQGDGRHRPTRLAAAGAAAVTIGAGLGIRAVASNAVTKYAGDALYTVMVYTLIVLVAPRAKPRWVAGGALAFSTAVEFFKLSGVPGDLGRHSTAARLVLGTTFNPPNLCWYAVGAVVAWLAHRASTTTATTAAAQAEPEPSR